MVAVKIDFNNKNIAFTARAAFRVPAINGVVNLNVYVINYALRA